jgi:hypothetical protein
MGIRSKKILVDTEESIEKPVIIVSDLFFDIYRNFNVKNQIDNMKALTKKELYLLLITTLDKHSDENEVAINNWLPFKDQCLEILDLQDDKEVQDEDLKSLIDESKDKYITTENIVSSDGSKLPRPYTKEEIREIRIDDIIE